MNEKYYTSMRYNAGSVFKWLATFSQEFDMGCIALRYVVGLLNPDTQLTLNLRKGFVEVQLDDHKVYCMLQPNSIVYKLFDRERIRASV